LNLETYKIVQRFIRRRLRNERLYSYLRRVLLFGQYFFHSPNEPDFCIFKALNTKRGGLIVDIGANGGQSAVAFGFLCPTFRIESFEPNPSLWSDLDFIKWLLGRRFHYHPVGLGKEKGQFSLYIPMQGNLPITTRASLHRDTVEIQLKLLANELGQHGTIKEVIVDILCFDDFNLHPDAVKIDVEGHELSVLEGMRKTIKNDRPVFLLEKNPETPDCQVFLKGYGYQFFNFNTKTVSLSLDAEHATNNWFAIPDSRIEDFVKT